MVVNKGLSPLEYADCLLDSPEFHENLKCHEKELEKTLQQIKTIINDVKENVQAAINLSQCQRTLAKSLNEFNFECIVSTHTNDEQMITTSLKKFSKLISEIEDEREKMLDQVNNQIVVSLEAFREDAIKGLKDIKEQLNKKTETFFQKQEMYLNLSTTKSDSFVALAEDALVERKREYTQESLNYVLKIQEVQEKIKFEFVEILLGFMSGWLDFYRLGHGREEDAKEYMTNLQHKVQKTREGYTKFQERAEELKSTNMNIHLKPKSEYTNQGYLHLMKKNFFSTSWQKYYCTYKKENKEFTMLQYNQQISEQIQSTLEKLTLASYTQCMPDFERRFCFDLTFNQKPNIVYTFQALFEKDLKDWLHGMDGKESAKLTPGKSITQENEYILNEVGFAFVKKCIEILEERGLEEEGLYRVNGVGTKIGKVLQLGLNNRKTESERLAFFTDDQYSDVLEIETITSALKQYLRKLKEPLMTYQYFDKFLAAAKQERQHQKICDIHALIHQLPRSHFEMLDIIIQHLKKVSAKSHINKMSIYNLSVVFGPIILISSENNLAALLEMKFNNLVIEILIENYELIFKSSTGKHDSIIQNSFKIPGSSNINRNYSFQGRNPQQSAAPSYSLYETKSSKSMNQKPPVPLKRAATFSSKGLSSGTNDVKSASPPTTLKYDSYQDARYVHNKQFLNVIKNFESLSQSDGLLKGSKHRTVSSNQKLS